MLQSTYNNQDRLRDYSSLFSRSEVLMWFRNDFRSINCKIERYDKNFFNPQRQLTYLDYLKHVYKILEADYPIEYVIKNSLLNEWLIKEIGVEDSVVLNEFRLGKVVADLAMFNGSSKVFEIKTIYDSDKRLIEQLLNYKKLFNQIYLIVPNSKISSYQKYRDVGIVSYNDSKSNQRFSVIRESKSYWNVDVKTIMHTLHTNEYKSIVEKFYKTLPEMTSFTQFNICYDLISKIPIDELNKLFIEEIKKRKTADKMSSRYFKEFNQLSLALKLSETERLKMLKYLRSPIIA